MEFNIQKFLVKNKLTKRARLSEDSGEGGMLKTDSEQDAMSGEEMFGDGEDSWYKDDSDSPEEFDQEPSAGDIKQDEPSLSKLHKKQAELKTLESQKDALLMQLRSNQISIDQYKESIGNIPAQIKKLRADIEKSMNVSVDDEESEF